MFRVKTDLASYAELTPTDDSPALYSCALLTAISVVISTAMSPASVYSQDSWKTPSPSVSVFEVDPSRMAIATSPSVQWSDMAEEDSDKRFTLKSPSVPSVFTPPQNVSFSMVKEDNDTVSHSNSDVVPSLANNAVHESIRSLVDVGSPEPFGKGFTKIKSQSSKKIDQQSPKHSRSSKAFRKVMNRLSFLPSKRELAQLRNPDAVAVYDNSPLLDFKVPEFRRSQGLSLSGSP